jgi:hypothetical protein
MHFAFDVALLLFVQQHGVGLARVGRLEVGRQLAHLQADAGNRQARRGFVDGGDGGDRVADVAHLVARQRKFVLRDGDHAIGHVAFVAGDHGAHAGQRQRL